MSGRRIAGWAALLAAVALLAAYGTMRAGWWNTDYATVRARYAGPPSRFVTVDGVPLHVRDEGAGPVVVMLHGSLLNLHEWDMVVDRLKGRYRIIRLDWPPYGVSGPDPGGVYSTARAADLLAGLVDRMKLGTFALVSTSNGANVALAYNARHPEHVQAMAFSILPLDRPSQTRKVDWRIVGLKWFHAHFLPDYHSHLWYRLILKDTTPARFHPTDEMVDMMYDMNNLPGAVARQKAYIASNTMLFQTSDVGAIAAKVTAPVLLQWCGYDTVISQSPRDSVRRFTHTGVDLVTYPDIGHFPMWEDPDRFSADLGHFLDRVMSGVFEKARKSAFRERFQPTPPPNLPIRYHPVGRLGGGAGRDRLSQTESHAEMISSTARSDDSSAPSRPRLATAVCSPQK